MLPYAILINGQTVTQYPNVTALPPALWQAADNAVDYDLPFIQTAQGLLIVNIPLATLATFTLKRTHHQ